MAEEWNLEVKVHAPSLEEAKSMLLQEATRIMNTNDPRLIPRAFGSSPPPRGMSTHCDKSYSDYNRPPTFITGASGGGN